MRQLVRVILGAAFVAGGFYFAHYSIHLQPIIEPVFFAALGAIATGAFFLLPDDFKDLFSLVRPFIPFGRKDAP